LRSFTLQSGHRRVELPLSVQRLVTFLSLHEHPLHRQHVAGTLWPETTDQRAAANLRSALWRLNQLDCPVVTTSGCSLMISPDVTVDVRRSATLAHELLRETEDDPPAVDPSLFAYDLLPDWYDDWLVVEREQFRQLRLRALEWLCARLTAVRRFGAAVEAAMAAIAGEPLRESAHRALAAVHLAEGNRAEAVRQYRFYERLLEDELGFSPSAQFQQLVGIA
jgi:DNA-binding SARP family transcriptional activator